MKDFVEILTKEERMAHAAGEFTGLIIGLLLGFIVSFAPVIYLVSQLVLLVK